MESPSPTSHGRFSRRATAIALLSAQIIATAGAWIGNSVATETIVVSGPLLTMIGLAVAIVTCPWYSWAALFVGLSAPVVCAIGAFIIAGFQLDPVQANRPIIMLLAIYLLCMAPTAIHVVKRILRQPPNLAIAFSLRWRYSLKSLLGMMTAVAILAVVLPAILEALVRDFPINFALFGIAAILSSVAVVWRFTKYAAAKKHRVSRPRLNDSLANS